MGRGEGARGRRETWCHLGSGLSLILRGEVGEVLGCDLQWRKSSLGARRLVSAGQPRASGGKGRPPRHLPVSSCGVLAKAPAREWMVRWPTGILAVPVVRATPCLIVFTALVVTSFLLLTAFFLSPTRLYAQERGSSSDPHSTRLERCSVNSRCLDSLLL